MAVTLLFQDIVVNEDRRVAWDFAESVVGDFSGQKIEYGAGYVVFERNGDNFLMSLYEGASLTRQYRVTRTVGSRIEQMYIGVQTRGPEPDGHPIYRLEGKLPFRWP